MLCFTISATSESLCSRPAEAPQCNVLPSDLGANMRYKMSIFKPNTDLYTFSLFLLVAFIVSVRAPLNKVVFVPNQHQHLKAKMSSITLKTGNA